MEFFNNHKKLFRAVFLFFGGLTLLVAIMPALDNQRNFRPLPDAEPLSDAAVKGKMIFIANGCVACHTQQVRNVDMDKTWGSRPSIAADYAGDHRIDVWRNTATLMGTERTGPDLTNVGLRQPSAAWNLTHLYNPRILVKESVMPAYTWLFTTTMNPNPEDVVVNVPAEFRDDAGDGKVVATPEALQLLAYLQSLKQTKLPDGRPVPDFLFKKKDKAESGGSGKTTAFDGAALYATNCQSCHQPNGEGLKGAFPPLKGSLVVLNDNPEIMVNIIMNGYSGRIKEGYGPMPAVGTNNNLSPEEITAIMNHEKTSWGNNARAVSPDEIKKLVDLIKLQGTTK
ncbi:MAG TPA: cbb3-type cytochrome c oxidase subunit II [Puia sp.]|nr:cbb3-type cytochrome c oxidase subunit II [Puia sp.]